MPSSYELGAAIGNNITNGFGAIQDKSAIDDILQQASQSNDPNAMDDIMAQLIQRVAPERQQMAAQLLQQKQQRILRQSEIQRAAPGLFQSNQLGPEKLINQESSAVDGSQQQQQGGIQSLPDDQLINLTGVKGYSEPAKQELRRRQEDRKLAYKKEEGNIKRNTDISQKFLEQSDIIAADIPKKQSSLDLMKDAIANKDLSFWSRDNLAEITGIEGFRSPEGAIFKTAGKEYFLGNISRAGARPNQWIEQQISDMMPKMGRSAEANLSVQRALQNELDLDKEKVRLTDKISSELESSLGYVPRDISTRVNKELSSYAEKKQKELYNDLRAIKSISEKNNQTFMKVPEGTPVSKLVAQSLLRQNNNDPVKAAEAATKLGYSY